MCSFGACAVSVCPAGLLIYLLGFVPPNLQAIPTLYLGPSWVQGLHMRLFPPSLGQKANGLTNPPPPIEVDALVDLVRQYAWTAS